MFFLATFALFAVAAFARQQPQWPLEFAAEIEQFDLKTNHTQHFHWQYSHSNDAEDFEAKLPTAEYVVSKALYSHHRDFNLFGCDRQHVVCRVNHLAGDLFVPPVATFKFVGTKTYRGIVVDHWVGKIGQDLFEYYTVEANDRPVVFFDHSRQIGVFFKEFKLVANWPEHMWTVPSVCV